MQDDLGSQGVAAGLALLVRQVGGRQVLVRPARLQPLVALDNFLAGLSAQKGAERAGKSRLLALAAIHIQGNAQHVELDAVLDSGGDHGAHLGVEIAPGLKHRQRRRNCPTGVAEGQPDPLGAVIYAQIPRNGFAPRLARGTGGYKYLSPYRASISVKSFFKAWASHFLHTNVASGA